MIAARGEDSAFGFAFNMYAGFLSLWAGPYNLHIVPKPMFRHWGYKSDITLGVELKEFGLGPIALLCWV